MRRRGSEVAFCAVLAAIAFASLLLMPARHAEAHALLEQSDPPVNARLQDAPTQVTGLFTESLDNRLSSLEVLDGTGERVDAGETAFGPEDNRMSTAIPETLAPGFYTVVWETLSSVDGHLFKGSFPFTVLNEDGTEPSGPRFEAAIGGYGGAKPGWVITKWASLLASAMLVGSLAFVAWVVRPASKEAEGALKQGVRNVSRRHLALLAWPSAGALVLTGISELVLKANDIGGLGSIDDALNTDWGEHWVQRQLVLAATAVALFSAGQLWRSGRSRLSETAVWAALAGGLAYQLLVAMVSHAGGVPGSFWATGADSLHLAAASVWVGMLAALGLLLWWSYRTLAGSERASVVAPHFQRFSTIAATSVVVMLASGTFNGLAQVPDLGAMFDTAYGRTLLIKLGVMALLLAVAGGNAFLLRPRAVDEGGSGVWSPRLTTAIRVELGLAVVVLLAAAVLIQYPTSRVVRDAESAAEAQEQPQAVVGFEELVQASDLDVSLTIAPNSVGTNSFRVFLFGSTGEVTRVRLRFNPPDPELGPSEIIADPVGPDFPNQYRAVGAFFTQPGSWEVQVDIRRREVDDVTALFGPGVQGSLADTGTKYDYPLTRGSWGVVAAVGAMLAALLVGIWATQWPHIPSPTPRVMRVTSGFGLVVGAGMLVVALLPDGGSGTGNPVEATAESITTGRSLFLANCAACHGQTGQGDGPLAETLDVPPADMRQHVPLHKESFLFQVISFGIEPIMPEWASTISERDRWNIINFLKSEFGIDAQVSSQ